MLCSLHSHRDIPVFHEIAGKHATYFSGTSGRDLADALRLWMRRDAEGGTPTTADMPWLTWEQSAARFTEVIFDGRWDAAYHADRQGSDRKQLPASSKPAGSEIIMNETKVAEEVD